MEHLVGDRITIRPFTEPDALQVRHLFITINRALSPTSLRDAFEGYIARALADEIDRISAYYGERDGGFWIAISGDKVVGTFGLERVSVDAMELRRMYVEPLVQRKGIGRAMLLFAEDECRRRNVDRHHPRDLHLRIDRGGPRRCARGRQPPGSVRHLHPADPAAPGLAFHRHHVHCYGADLRNEQILPP